MSMRYSGGGTRIPIPVKLPDHPRLFLNDEEIAGIRRRAKTNRETARMVRAAVKFAGDWLREKHRQDVSATAAYHVPRELGLAYQFTRDKRFAEAAAEILLACADRLPLLSHGYMGGFISGSSLEEGVVTSDLCWGYDLIIPSGVLNTGDRHRIDKLFKASALEAGHRCHHPNSSNWRARGVMVLAAAGFVTGDHKLIAEALNGVYEPERMAYLYGFAQQLAHVMRSDGTIWESQMHYTYLTLSCMCCVAEMARHCGIDLWRIKLPALLNLPAGALQTELGMPGPRSLRYAIDQLFYRAFPGQLYALTGNNQLRDLDGDPRVLGAAYNCFHDPKYAWSVHREKRLYGHKRLIEEDSTVRRPQVWDLAYGIEAMPKGGFSFEPDTDIGLTGRHRNGSTIFPEGGYAVLRGKCDDPASTALEFHFGPYGSAHDHPDKLGVSLYGLGKILAPDPGKMGYGDGFQGSWGKQTIAHNTVTIAETSQYPQGYSEDMWGGLEKVDKPSVGELIFFHSGKYFKAVRATCDNAYDGCLLDRTLVLLNPFVIDIYRIGCVEDCLIDLAWHGFGVARSEQALAGRRRPPSDRFGYRHLTDVRTGSFAGRWSVIWDCGGIGLRMIQTGFPRTTHLLGATPSADDARTVAIARRKGRSALFVTVLEPFRHESLLENVECFDAPGGIGVRVSHQRGVDSVVVPVAAGRGRIGADEGSDSCFAAWLRRTRSGRLVARDTVRQRMPDAL